MLLTLCGSYVVEEDSSSEEETAPSGYSAHAGSGSGSDSDSVSPKLKSKGGGARRGSPVMLRRLS